MADLKVSDMTEATTLTITSDFVYGVVGGNSRKLTMQTLKEHFVQNDTVAITASTPEVITFSKSLVNANYELELYYTDASGNVIDFVESTAVSSKTANGFTFTGAETGNLRYIAIVNV